MAAISVTSALGQVKAVLVAVIGRRPVVATGPRPEAAIVPPPEAATGLAAVKPI